MATFREGGGVYSVCARPQPYDHRPSYLYYAGAEHVGFSPTGQDIACTKRDAP